MKLHRRTYRCILIENEPLAIDMMLEYISCRKELKLVHVIETVDAYRTLLEDEVAMGEVDILFLDIKVRGGELLNQLDRLTGRKIIVVLVTAYAIQSLDALPPEFLRYFIPKPISLKDFNDCIDEILLTN